VCSFTTFFFFTTILGGMFFVILGVFFLGGRKLEGWDEKEN
jgi:hypothetical protein